MSSKKDKYNSKDIFYMSLALNLARQRFGLTGTNPPVGCVIVKKGKIISFGQTGPKGRPHAEYNAIKNCNKNLKNSTMYVSLEPCSHYGITPPCTDLIINSKIKKIYFSINDIDKRTSNTAKKILVSKNIIVKRFLLKKEAGKLYKQYFFSKKNNLPYVVAKIACSRDNFITTKNKYITNKYSKEVSHLLRYFNQGILISSKTLNSDNSKLTCRLKGLESNSPIRLVLDKNLSTKMNSYIINTSKTFKTFIFYNKENRIKKEYFKKKGVRLIHFNLNKNNQFDLKLILKKIYQLGIDKLLVEGGKKLTYNFLKLNLFNEFYLFKANSLLLNKGKNNISPIIKLLSTKFYSKKKINTYLDKDKLIYYY
tara:strand:+ start:24 stop:1124 length:1101 start_codon:yes stop_codon:yes gene_type:complete